MSKFITALALWRHLDPQNALFEHFEQIFEDFRLFDHYNIEIILQNYGGDCSQNSGDYYKIDFSQNFSPSWPYEVILTPKNALFEHFEHFFVDFCLFDHYNIELILENHEGDCSQYSGDYCKIKFSQNSSPSWPYEVILTPKNALFEHFEQFFVDFRIFDHYNIEIIL